MDKEYKSVRLHEVKPYPGNARRGNQDMIRTSLKENDQYRDIVVQKSTGYILAGNNTWLAAQAEGRATIDIAVIDVDDEAARKIVLIDNKANDEATYEKDELAELLKQLDGDFLGTGFVQSDLDKLLDSLTGRGKDGDVLPPMPVSAEIDAGTIFKLGEHRLLVGDNTIPEYMDMVLDGAMIDLTVTSPPYNQKLDTFKPSGMRKEHPKWVERMASSYDDDRPEPEYQQEQVDILDAVYDRTRPGGAFFYNHKIRYRDKAMLSPFLWLIRSKWTMRMEIIWDRQTGIALNARMFIPADERIYWMTKEGADFYFANTTEIKSWTSVWDITPKAEVQMSAPYPVEVPRRAIEACSERGDLVFEPYCGSGTTIIAAEELGRRCYAMEVNPTYAMAAVNRWEAYTGERAEVIE